MRIKINLLVSFLIFSVNTFCQQIGDGRALQIADFTIPLKSGAYQSSNAIGNNPDISYGGWQHLFVIRHSNDVNDYQLQLSSSYSINDRLFFRKLAGGLESMNPTWIELATRGANSFIGDQSINGNLGIGTNSPASKLHISNAGISGQLDYNLILQKTMVTDDNKSAVGLLFSTECCGPFGKSAIVHERTAGYGVGDLHFLNNNAIDRTNPTLVDSRMTISSNGNVGIGTTKPTSKLTVAGNINSREVKVTVDAGADFVFAEDYALPTLDSVDNYIKANKHLPEIASAAEMKKDGINLSEMNIKLLQKVEEQTLYIIEMNKQLQVVKEQIEQLKKSSSK
jgi:hypothetical protein